MTDSQQGPVSPSFPQPANKYQGEQDGRHPGLLHWPGADGFPFLGKKAPLLQSSEFRNLPIVGYAYHRVFDLSDDVASAYYEWIRDRIRNGIFRQDYVERHWDADKRNMIVYLEWTQIYATSPQNGENGNGRGDTFLLE